MWEAPPFALLDGTVRDPSTPVGKRMRAAYFLRQVYDIAIRNEEREDTAVVVVDDDDDGGGGGGSEGPAPSSVPSAAAVIESLSAGLSDRRHGSLLRHEFAYVMGQLRDARCCEALERTLGDREDCVMVRHECGEALGAIGARRSEEVLERAVRDSPDTPEIGETCELALAHMRWKRRRGMGEEEGEEEPAACACMLSPYSSIDPAPPHPSHMGMSPSDVGRILTDGTLPLFERYRAMFSLRNMGGTECALVLGRALVSDVSSPLLRHEVAYVLGQMQDAKSADYLASSLRRVDEHAMVRHESAEALGAIMGEGGEGGGRVRGDPERVFGG